MSRLLACFRAWRARRRAYRAQLLAAGHCLLCGERKHQGQICDNCWMTTQW